MANYYVYSPLNGYTTSEIENNEYCDGVGGGTHWITGGSGFDRPIDIGFLDGAPYYYSRQLDLVVSSNIQSAIFTQSTNMCSSDPGSPWNTAVDVKLYTGTGGTGSLIGTVRYGHVDGARFAGALWSTGSPLDPDEWHRLLSVRRSDRRWYGVHGVRRFVPPANLFTM